MVDEDEKVVNNVYTLGGNQDFVSFDNIIKREKGATLQKGYALSIYF